MGEKKANLTDRLDDFFVKLITESLAKMLNWLPSSVFKELCTIPVICQDSDATLGSELFHLTGFDGLYLRVLAYEVETETPVYEFNFYTKSEVSEEERAEAKEFDPKEYAQYIEE